MWEKACITPLCQVIVSVVCGYSSAKQDAPGPLPICNFCAVLRQTHLIASQERFICNKPKRWVFGNQKRCNGDPAGACMTFQLLPECATISMSVQIWDCDHDAITEIPAF